MGAIGKGKSKAGASAKKKPTKEAKKPLKKSAKKERVQNKSKGKELVPVQPKRNQTKSTKKSKFTDDEVEIIDTRKSKRTASLNALNILTASYLSDRPKQNVKKKPTKEAKKPLDKSAKKEKVQNKSKGKELVPVQPKRNQTKSTKKRKLIDDDVEIIDTRTCKRMASLNASAILAASYLPDKVFKRSRSIESSRSIGSTVEMIRETKISSSISRVEVPTTTALHSCHDHVVVESAKTIETVKGVTRMSGKIRDRLVAIEMMERENSNVSNLDRTHIINSLVKQTSRRKIKGSRYPELEHCTSTASQASISRPEAAGVTTTEYQKVTKVQINTGRGTHMKREKMAHQIETILEKDSVEREYQFQTKATTQSYRIQMESSSYNQPLANIISANAVHTMPCLPIHTPNFSNLHLNNGTSVIQTTPILMSQGLNHGTCFSHSNQPVLQIACNPSYRPIQPSSATISQLPVLNIQSQYPQHYASAFSVPHYTNTATPSNYPSEAYGFYPTGSIVQPIYDPFLRTYPLLKPIPFHAAPAVNRTDQNFSTFTPSSHANQAQSISSIQSQQPRNSQAPLVQQPAILTPVAPHLNRSTLVESQIDTLRTPINNNINTSSFIIHPASDISRRLKSHEILSHQDKATLPVDVAGLPNNNANNISNNNLSKPFLYQQNFAGPTISLANGSRPSSIAFLGASMPHNNLQSHQTSPNIFSTLSNSTMTPERRSTSDQVSSKASNTPAKTNSSEVYCKPASTIITEIFPIKKPTEYKKSPKETQVSITPLVMRNSPINRTSKNNSSDLANNRSGSSSRSYTISSLTDAKKCDNRAPETTSNSRALSSSTTEIQTIRVSPNLSISSLVSQKVSRKDNDGNNSKKSSSVKLKRSPTLCTNTQKKHTSTTIQCIPVNNAHQLKKKVANVSKTRIDIITPECGISPNSELNLAKKGGKKRLSHGWTWEGRPKRELVYVKADDGPKVRDCYKGICHIQGDVIKVRDCVLLRSGPRKTDLHFVAKIGALWEAPETGEMMMSLLWYYRPEHTEPGRKPHQMPDEIFASKHHDVNSVACIDDKCYVLTFNEYCRYRRQLKMKSLGLRKSLIDTIVPRSVQAYYRKNRLPSGQVCADRVFCCRRVYDFRLKRTLKNPI